MVRRKECKAENGPEPYVGGRRAEQPDRAMLEFEVEYALEDVLRFSQVLSTHRQGGQEFIFGGGKK